VLVLVPASQTGVALMETAGQIRSVCRNNSTPASVRQATVETCVTLAPAAMEIHVAVVMGRALQMEAITPAPAMPDGRVNLAPNQLAAMHRHAIMAARAQQLEGSIVATVRMGGRETHAGSQLAVTAWAVCSSAVKGSVSLTQGTTTALVPQAGPLLETYLARTRPGATTAPIAATVIVLPREAPPAASATAAGPVLEMMESLAITRRAATAIRTVGTAAALRTVASTPAPARLVTSVSTARAPSPSLAR
jgi:hypothetical protein